MTTSPNQPDAPLVGLKVLDIATIIAAPFAAALLADYGADVLKVELPGNGDGARDFPPFKDGKSLWWKVINRNKKFMTLDLRKERGAEILKQLIAEHDVLIENFRPGTLERWGLTRDVLWEINPRLVILRATGFGQDGPYSKRPGFARLFEAMGGLTYITGQPSGEPMHSGYPLGDAIGGMFGAVGVLTALLALNNDPDRKGEEIDLSMLEAILKLVEFLPIEFDQTGVVRERSGNRSQYSAPAAVYQTGDGKWVSLSGSTDTLFACNCRSIGREDLITDPRFDSNAARCDYSDELNGIFEDWFGTHSLDEARARFEEYGGTLAPIYSADQIFEDPHIIARQAITPVADEDFGEVRIQNVVPRFRNHPTRHRHSAKCLGADTDAILKSIGKSAEEIKELRSNGIV
ncbi:CaiB/BaiF CoA transferase family protein [Ruegeria hyattellae]|uniref:CaiB/BaiF CoA transferase family protein n=1 Tax=Ruegeria hyattellae TaxID=3233337 RepID=UPI00355BD29F